MTLPFEVTPEPQTTDDADTSAVIVGLVEAGPMDAALAPGEPPLHVTLAYLGQAADLPYQTYDAIDNLLTTVTGAVIGPSFTVSGYGRLGKDSALVAFIESETLADLRSQLVDNDTVSEAMASTKQFPVWTPHVTFAYGDAGSEDSVAPFAGQWANIDRLGLWWGEEHIEYPFSGTSVLVDTDDDELAEGTTDIDSIDMVFDPVLTAAVNATFNAEHPRGRDGKFIEKFGIVKFMSKLSGTWQYGKVLNIKPQEQQNELDKTTQSIIDATNAKLGIKTPDPTETIIEVRPSHLDGTPLDTGHLDLVNLTPNEVYSAPTMKAHLNIDHADAQKVGAQAGSNPGGMYSIPDPLTGTPTKYYVKQAKSAKQGHNEALANDLYQEAGVLVPDVNYDTADGNIYSKIVPGKMDMANQIEDPNSDWSKALRRDFAVDAWLANWDFAGLVWDNVLTDDGSGLPVRIDNGGALLYRAQGSPKGEQFSGKVTELDAYRSGKKAAVYGPDKLTKAEELDGAQRVLAISPARIQEMVAANKLPKSLADTLIARRAYIADYYNLPLPESVPDPAVNVPAVDTKDAAISGGLPRSYSAPLSLTEASLILQPGDIVHLPDNGEQTYAIDMFGKSSKTHGYQQFAQWNAEFGADAKVQIKKVLPPGAPEVEHNAKVPPTALASLRWDRGDQVVSPQDVTFDVIGAHSGMQTLLLRKTQTQDDLTPNAPFLWSSRQSDSEPWTTVRWDPPSPEKIAADQDAAKAKSVAEIGELLKPVSQAMADMTPAVQQAGQAMKEFGDKLAQVGQNQPDGQAAAAAEKIKHDLVTPLPDGGPPAAKKVAAKAGDGIGEGKKSMPLGDGTVAATGDAVLSKKDGNTYTFVKPKGPYAVVTDPDGEDPDKTYLKMASTLTQPGKKKTADVSTAVADAPKTADGKVPELGMIASAKDGHTGEITLISPDGKFTFITDSSGKRKRKSTSQVTILSQPTSVGEDVANLPEPEPESTPEPDAEPVPPPAPPTAVALGESHALENWMASGTLKPGLLMSSDNQTWFEIRSVGPSDIEYGPPNQPHTASSYLHTGGGKSGLTFFVKAKDADAPKPDAPESTLPNDSPEIDSGAVTKVTAPEIMPGDVIMMGDPTIISTMEADPDGPSGDFVYTDHHGEGGYLLNEGTYDKIGSIKDPDGVALPYQDAFKIAQPGDVVSFAAQGNAPETHVVAFNDGSIMTFETGPGGEDSWHKGIFYSGESIVLHRPSDAPAVSQDQAPETEMLYPDAKPTVGLMDAINAGLNMDTLTGEVWHDPATGTWFMHTSDGWHAWLGTSWDGHSQETIPGAVKVLDPSSTKTAITINDPDFPTGHTIYPDQQIAKMAIGDSGVTAYFAKTNTGWDRLSDGGQIYPWESATLDKWMAKHNGTMQVLYDPLNPGGTAPALTESPNADLPDDWNIPGNYDPQGKQLKKVVTDSTSPDIYLEQQDDGTYKALLIKDSPIAPGGKVFSKLSEASYTDADLVGEDVQDWPPLATGMVPEAPSLVEVGYDVTGLNGYIPPPGSKVKKVDFQDQGTFAFFVQTPGTGDQYYQVKPDGTLWLDSSGTAPEIFDNGEASFNWKVTDIPMGAPAVEGPTGAAKGPAGLDASVVSYAPMSMDDLPTTVRNEIQNNGPYKALLHYDPSQPGKEGTYYLIDTNDGVHMYRNASDEIITVQNKTSDDVLTALKAAQQNYPDASVTDVTPTDMGTPSADSTAISEITAPVDLDGTNFHGYTLEAGDVPYVHVDLDGNTHYVVAHADDEGPGEGYVDEVGPGGQLSYYNQSAFHVMDAFPNSGETLTPWYPPNKDGDNTATSPAQPFHGYVLGPGEIGFDLSGSDGQGLAVVKKPDGGYHKVDADGTTLITPWAKDDKQFADFTTFYGLHVAPYQPSGSIDAPPQPNTVAKPTVVKPPTMKTVYLLQPGEQVVDMSNTDTTTNSTYVKGGNGEFYALIDSDGIPTKLPYSDYKNDQEFKDIWGVDPKYYTTADIVSIGTPIKPGPDAPDPTPNPAKPTGTTSGGVSYPGSVKPGQDDVLAWGGKLTKDGYIPTSGMKVKGKGPMTGTVISISKDKTKATVLTDKNTKSTRLIEALQVDHAASITAYAPSVSLDVPDGMPVAVDTPAQALTHTMADGKFRAIMHGHPGVRYGQMTLSRMTTPSNNKVGRVFFTLTPDQRKQVTQMLSQGPAAPTQKGAWDTSNIPSGSVKIGDRISMRYGSSSEKWKPDTNADNPTHTVSGVEPQPGGVMKVSLINDATKEIITSNFHTDSSQTVQSFVWNPDKPKPIAKTVNSKLSLSAQAQAQGWTKTNGVISAAKGDRLDVEPGKNVPNSNNAFQQLFNGSNEMGVRQVADDGTVIEITDLSTGNGSHKGVVVVTVPEGGTADQLNGALSRIGVPYTPMAQSDAKRNVLTLLSGMVNFNYQDIDTTKGMSEQSIFTKLGTTIGVPDVGWQDVYVGVDESTGSPAYYWSDRVTNAMANKGKHNLVYRAATSSSPEAIAGTIQFGSANAITKRLTGMVYAPSGQGLGASASSDSSNNAGHGSFMSAGSKSYLPTSNSLASYKTVGMMAYHRPEAIYGRIMDYRASNGDAFGNSGTGTNNVAKALGSSVQDYWMGGGLPPESLGLLAVSSAANRSKAIDILHQRGIYEINGRKVEDMIITLSSAGSKKPVDLPPYIRPSTARPILDVPESYADTPVVSAGKVA